MISARIVADSRNPKGVRLTSWILTYPRFIHSEFMTHRCFSRNAASSRAIPIGKMIETIRRQPAWPVRWGSKGKGMGDGGELRAEVADDLKVALEALRNAALDTVQIADDIGLAKQVANRYIEPWAHMTVLATATDHRNFFQLRAHPAAQPEFQVLAYMMLREYRTHCPIQLDWGDWHIPNLGPKPSQWDVMTLENQLNVSVARCARLSYLTFDGEHSVEKDLETFAKLAGPPLHASPFEHVAEAVSGYHEASNYDMNGMSGWRQYRKHFKNENGLTANLDQIAATEPEWVSKIIDAQ